MERVVSQSIALSNRTMLTFQRGKTPTSLPGLSVYVSIRSAGGICFRGKKERDNDLSGRGTILSLFPARQDRDGLLGRSEYFGSNDEMTIKGTTKRIHLGCVARICILSPSRQPSNLHPEDAFRSGARGYPRLGVPQGPRQRAKKVGHVQRALSHSIEGKFDFEVGRCVAIPSSFPF